MKRFIVFIAILTCSALLLVSCGEKVTKDALVATENKNGVNLTIRFDAEGDKIVKMEQSADIDLSGVPEEQVKQIMDAGGQAGEAYTKIKGCKYELKELGKNKYKEIITINIDKDNIKELGSKGLLPIDKNADFISLKKTKEALQSQGITVKEKETK